MYEALAIIGAIAAVFAFGVWLGHRLGAGARIVLEQRNADLEADLKAALGAQGSGAAATAIVMDRLRAHADARPDRAGVRMLLLGGRPDAAAPPAGRGATSGARGGARSP